METRTKITLGLLVAGILCGALILNMKPSAPSAEHEHGEAGHAGDDIEHGPHNGRLLQDDDFALEVTIFEKGVPPEFRIYPMLQGKPLDPTKVALSIELRRLGGAVDTFRFTPAQTYLRGDGEVHEPHSFDVKVTATVNGKAHSWSYAAYEGRTDIAADAAQAAGIVTATAGPGSIRTTATVTGRIVVDPTRAAHVRARFPGVVKELRYGLGAHVGKGDVVAMVESNDSLQTYAVKAPIDGTIVAQDATVGEMASDTPMVEIADTRRVYAELHIFPRDAAKLKIGQPVQIKAFDGSMTVDGVITTILPTMDVGSQTVPARVAIDNTAGLWRTGMLVDAEIVTEIKDAPLAVRTSGLQAFRDATVVFAKVGDTYEVRMLELGARDSTMAEVVQGLTPGTVYVTENSYLIKADIEKSGASHDH